MGGASLRPEDYDPRLNAFVLFEGRELREVVCTEKGSTAYRVDAGGEVAMAARLL